MNQAGVRLLVALALLTAPVAASAQPAKPAAAEAEGEAGEEAGDGGEGGGGDEIPIDEPGEDPGEESGLEDICEIDPSQCPTIDMDASAARELEAEIFAVQQIYALRVRRFEINPYVGVTLNDQFVSHTSIGGVLNYYILNWLAVGVSGGNHYGMNSELDFNFQTSRAARIGMPITEYAGTLNGNVTFVPVYGKFAGFGEFIFHYDLYVVLGGGIVATRPIAVVDPDNRTFDYEFTGTWGGGVGLRIFFNRWLALMLELRDYCFFDRLENPGVATGFDAAGNPRAQDESTWLADDREWTNNWQAQLGLSIFLPFSWEYRLPK